MFALPTFNKKASSRAQIALKGARDDTLLLPNDHYRAVLEVSPLNFELKSEAEQDAIIDTYESVLNSIGVPLQIIIRTREIDMDSYLARLNARLDAESEPIYQQQIQYYDEFIRSLIQSNKILTRHFYIVVPYSHCSNGKADFETAKAQLALTADIVSKGMSRLGMQTRRLSSLEILDLFYCFYNPAQAKIQPLTQRALQAIHTTLIQKGRTDA